MTTETAIQSQTMIECANNNMEVWRNNSGAFKDETGRMLRYGLANSSAQLNARIKSSDLICITPVVCYVTSVGWTTLGVFTAIECKPSCWHQTPGDDRALAQQRFHDIVRKAGGFAGFVTNPKDIHKIIKWG